MLTITIIFALPPIVRLTSLGIRGVSPSVVEAARAFGATPGQILTKVELPLATPVILAGIRVSTIINVGTATIGSTVGAKGLGEVIIAGLQTGNQAYIAQGAVLVALLAIMFDTAFRLVGRRQRPLS